MKIQKTEEPVTWFEENINYFILGLILLIMLSFLVFIIYKARKDNNTIFNTLSHHYNRHSFLIVFIIPILTLLAFSFLDLSKEIKGYLSTISFSIVGIGIFSGVLKYINSLYFVKTHIKSIILSPDFKKIINDQFESFVFSDKFLSSLDEAQLKKNWKNITYFKYKNKFPVLWEKMNLKAQLDNYFFQNNSIKYYYRGFRVHYNVELIDNNIIKFVETSDFTIVSNVKEKIELNFWVGSIEKDCEEIKTEIDQELTIIDGKKLADLIKNSTDESYRIADEPRLDNKTGKYKKDVVIPLSGKNEYQIEKVVTMTQRYDVDRSISFSSGKIIDDLFISITCCDRLKAFFHELNMNKFRPDNITIKGLGYKNKKIIMPGEIFILFIDKLDNHLKNIRTDQVKENKD